MPKQTPRMATSTPQLVVTSWLNRIRRYQVFFVPVAFIMLIGVIVVPMSPFVLDVLIAANIALAVIILLTVLFVESPLDFSGFPSLLLATTLVRLVLNIASTRLILTADASTPEEATAVAGLSMRPLVDHHRGWTHGRFVPLLLPAILGAGLLWWEGWLRVEGPGAFDILTPLRLVFFGASVAGWYTHLLLDGLFRIFPHDPV